ncbi:M23 family metallopeptidase [Desulfosporosinus shakirovi]|uniref:M23 family metallopeptidase n=1 Tax=Desulfosporosinus shakirovi TaxID=2885154 RepID=UPI001E52E871|nr:M23 family metallopeptidase [Desulfosporosinus sp. SRJS8]MCB8816292.1 M23 family metallopeptidase [Desulfosporosinus sp. SRJS8]
MRIPLKLVRGLAQISLLVVLAIIIWQVLHRPPNIPPDVYPYLNTISPSLVKQCVQENQKSPHMAYEDLLAIHSTIPKNEAQKLIDQLQDNITMSDLNWGMLPADTIKAIGRHREILREYSYYHPNKYTFPVAGTTWYEDSYGADREGGVRRHEGTDLFGKEGTSIISSCGGEIEQLGWNRLGGERVGVRGDDGNYYYYAHLQYISAKLVKGERIEAGEFIGGMGHTGDALTTPDHLHFGIELPNGEWTNPYPFLAVWHMWERGEKS